MFVVPLVSFHADRSVGTLRCVFTVLVYSALAKDSPATIVAIGRFAPRGITYFATYGHVF